MRQPSNQEPNSQNNGGILTPVEIVAKAILSVNKVATDILSVVTVANNEATVKDVSLNMSSIIAVADIKQAVSMLANDLTNIDLVAEHLGQVGNISNNMARLLLLHGKMNEILRLESHLDGLNEITLNMGMLEEVKEAIPDIATLISHMVDIVKVAENLDGIKGVLDNLDSLVTLSLNLDAVKVLNENIDIIIASADYVEQIEENLHKLELIEQNVINLEASATESKNIAIDKANESATSAAHAEENNTQSLANKNASEQAASSALGYKNQAKGYSQTASTKASEASSSANSAESSKQAAKESEDKALESENKSKQNADKTGEDRTIVENLAQTVGDLSQQVALGAQQVQSNKNSVDESLVAIEQLNQSATSAASTASQQANVATNEANRAKAEADRTEDLLDTKVDKQSGKGLSSNDYTNQAKQAVDNLGTAASRDVMKHALDINTLDAMLFRGAFGIGGYTSNFTTISSGSFHDLKITGIYGTGLLVTDGPNDGNQFIVFVMGRSSSYTTLIAVQDTGVSASTIKCFIKHQVNGVWSDWDEFLHTGNTGTAVTHNVTESAIDTTTGRLLKAGDLGLWHGATNVSDLSSSEINRTRFFRILPNAIGGTGLGSSVLTIPYDGTPRIRLLAIADNGRLFVGDKNGAELTPEWIEQYNQRNAVGTVSQENGIPTGGLMDWGETPNGRFFRYANGLLICDRIQGSFDLDHNASFRWTFPAPFVDTKLQTRGERRDGASTSTGISILKTNAYSENRFNRSFYLMRLDGTRWGTSGSIVADMFAIGRWY